VARQGGKEEGKEEGHKSGILEGKRDTLLRLLARAGIRRSSINGSITSSGGAKTAADVLS
jgi:hypothetical protein